MPPTTISATTIAARAAPEMPLPLSAAGLTSGDGVGSEFVGDVVGSELVGEGAGVVGVTLVGEGEVLGEGLAASYAKETLPSIG